MLAGLLQMCPELKQKSFSLRHSLNSIDIYLLKLNHANTSTMYKICSTLTIKTPERRH